MTSTPPWYEDPAAIDKRIGEDGLAGLHAVLDARRKACEDEQRLSQSVYLHGAIVSDTYGQVHVVLEDLAVQVLRKHARERFDEEEDAPRPQRFALLEEEVQEVLRRLGWWSVGLGPYPARPGDRCDRCALGWNLDDCHKVADRRGEDWRHPECHRLEVVLESLREIDAIVKAQEIPVRAHYLVPNRYWPDGTHPSPPPWHVLVTPRGRILVGWRKRVVVVDWSDSSISAKGADVVARIDITHGDSMVHCYGIQEMAKALSRLRESVESTGGWGP